MNPLAYAFYKRELKTELKRLSRCNRNRNPRSESGARGARAEPGKSRTEAGQKQNIANSLDYGTLHNAIVMLNKKHW